MTDGGVTDCPTWTIVEYRTNAIGIGSALVWVVNGTVWLVALLTGHGGLTAWAFLLQTPVWLVASLRQSLVVTDETVTGRSGFRSWSLPTASIEEVRFRSGSLQLLKDGRVAAGTSLFTSPWIDGEQVHDQSAVGRHVRESLAAVSSG